MKVAITALIPLSIAEKQTTVRLSPKPHSNAACRLSITLSTNQSSRFHVAIDRDAGLTHNVGVSCLDRAMETPLTLRSAYEKWSHEGSPAQPPMAWKLDKWTSRFSEHQEFLTELRSEPLDRAAVARVGEDLDSEEQAVKLFLASMIWGFGTAGYGPFRTKRILETPGAGCNLLQLARIASQEGGLKAFEHFASKSSANRNYLKYLGPSFVTKYIYFAQAASSPATATPVMDAVVRRWFAANTPETRLKLHPAHTESYEKYVGHLTNWAEKLNPERPLHLDQVEYLIFKELRNSGSLPTDSESELPVLELIDRLKAHALAEELIAEKAAELLDELEGLFAPSIERAPQEQ